MGIYLPVCSAADLNLMPSPTPPSHLVSVASCGTPSGILKTQKFVSEIRDTKIFLDNGMYSFFQHREKGGRVIFDDNRPIRPDKNTINIAAYHVAQIAALLKPNVLIVPDLPVPKSLKCRGHDHGDEEYQFTLVMYHNKVRAKEITYYRDRYFHDVELYYAFQGYTIKHLHSVMEEINGLYFEGFCFATRALSWNKLLALMLLLKTYNVRKIHILAGSNLSTMVIGAFAARHLFDEVSYDSHNWLFFANKSCFRLFGSMDAVQVVQGKPIRQGLKTTRCDCHHCNGRTIADIAAMNYDNRKHNLLAQHNYFIEIETAKEYFKHSVTPEALRDFLLSKSHRKDLIYKIHAALSLIYQMKELLNNKDIVNGIADQIYHYFI